MTTASNIGHCHWVSRQQPISFRTIDAVAPHQLFLPSVAAGFVVATVLALVVWLPAYRTDNPKPAKDDGGRRLADDTPNYAEKRFQTLFRNGMTMYGFFSLWCTATAMALAVRVFLYRAVASVHSWPQSQDFAIKEFKDGGLTLLFNTGLCVWLSFVLTRHAVAERDPLLDTVRFGLKHVVRPKGGRRKLWRWLRRLLDWLDELTRKSIEIDVNRAVFKERIERHVENRASSVAKLRLESPLVLLAALFTIGVTFVELWWISGRDYGENFSIVLLNWTSPFLIGECMVVIAYAIEQRALAPDWHRLRLAAVSTLLVFLMTISLVIYTDYFIMPILAMLASAIVAALGAVAGTHWLLGKAYKQYSNPPKHWNGLRSGDSTLVLVQSAQGFVWNGDLLTLHGVASTMRYVSDRPKKVIGFISIEQFMSFWSALAERSDGTMTYARKDADRGLVGVSLGSAKFDADEIQYKASVTRGSLPRRGDACQLYLYPRQYGLPDNLTAETVGRVSQQEAERHEAT